MSGSANGLWHVNPTTGMSSRCRAKTPESCRWAKTSGGLGHYETKQEADAASAASIAAKAAEAETPTALSKTDGLASTSDGDGAQPPVHERVSTLLTDKVPLKDERSGKVPTLDPGDDSVKAQGKLAAYLWRNFDGDADEAEEKALEQLYGEPVKSIDPSSCDYSLESIPLSDSTRTVRRGNETITLHTGEWTDEELAAMRQRKFERLQRYRSLLQDKLGGAEVSAYWQAGHAVLVSRGRRTASTMVPDATLTKSQIPVRVLNLGSLLAAAAVSSEMEAQSGEPMDKAAKTALADALLEGNRRAVSVMQLNGRECYGESTTILGTRAAAASRRLGIDLGEPPAVEPGDNSESMEWAEGALSTLRKMEADGRVPARHKAAVGVYEQTLENHLRSCRLVNMGRQGAYRKAISALLDDESDQQANLRYLKRIAGKHSATVYEDKKNRDPEHDAAGRASSFAADFGRIEVDDSVDLAKFGKISSEYNDYKRLLPASSVKPDLRFRMTGRHHATGLYTIVGDRRNMAVDPRYPSSFTHEWFHHLDFSSADGKQLSRDPEFKTIVAHYKEAVDREAMRGTDPDRYLAPTEIFARAGELWMRERDRKAGGRSSFLDVDSAYDSEFDYKPLLDMRDEVFAFMNKRFGGEK